ncbi:metallophosphoesterase family protein [Novosphingobium colocasiae]|uniref:Metallophosphoesterase n=1 Tax=Novosphingobium colocasiae TaxID=1256513 RepID=A0A918UGN3_9SPHN|nr:metallophosphoesterase [Novosphingobium colocasiae]GGZ05274.1 metallophosphoesterase [Novosphingobium colocasiae]
MTERPIRLFHISDIHFGLEDARAIRWAQDAVADERPDAVIITGDLTMRARSREFTAACHWIQALDVPVSVEVGNHDIPYFNLYERFFAPYRRFRAIEHLVEAEIDLPGLAIVPLKTTTRAQWQRFPWSNGWVTAAALQQTLTAIDALPAGTRALVACHHPLPERREKDGKLLTINGDHAMAALAGRNVLAVLSGHIHDPFDLTAQTEQGPLRMIGAGTLSRRIRSTPPSFNELVVIGDTVRVTARNLEQVHTADMQIPALPENALPPREPGEPVAPVAHVPAVDPPVH